MKRILIILSIIVVLFSISGCKGKEKESATNNQGQKLPSVLEELIKLSDEVVKGTMDKDWSGSLDTTKEIQLKWNELYPRLQQKGISSLYVDNFVQDLNELSDILIAKTLTLPRNEEKNQGQDQEMKEEEKTQTEEGQSQEGQNNSQENKSEGNKSEESVKASSDSRDNNGSEDGAQEGQKKEGKAKNQNPQKSLEEIDPLFDMASDELIIVDSAVELLKHIPNFSALFDEKVPSDVLRLKYLVYHINVASRQAKWQDAEDTVLNINDVWESVEPKALEADENLKLQVSQCINEIEEVVNQGNQTLIGVKSNSTIEVLNRLIKKMEEG